MGCCSIWASMESARLMMRAGFRAEFWARTWSRASQKRQTMTQSARLSLSKSRHSGKQALNSAKVCADSMSFRAIQSRHSALWARRRLEARKIKSRGRKRTSKRQRLTQAQRQTLQAWAAARCLANDNARAFGADSATKQKQKTRENMLQWRKQKEVAWHH